LLITLNLSLLLRNYRKTNNAKALQMVEKTLNFMYRGGMYDHVGFGFFSLSLVFIRGYGY
jgi:uncharacterized protein